MSGIIKLLRLGGLFLCINRVHIMSLQSAGTSEPLRARRENLRLIALTGLCAGASAALGFAFIAVPNIELITTAIFLSGMLLGPARGIIVGVVAELIFAGLNPMGMSFPPLMAAQVAGMALSGFAGGIIAPALTSFRPGARSIALGVVGFLLTLNYDIWTTLSFPLSAGFNAEQTLTTLKLGIPFAIPHLAGNTLIFALALGPAYRNLKRLVPAGIMVILALAVGFPGGVYAGDAVYRSESGDWEYIYYEDTGDILLSVPGFFHYDLALLGQPVYLFYEGGAPKVTLYGLPMNSRFHGGVDFTLFPPGYIDNIEVAQAYRRGLVSGRGLTALTPRLFDPETPYSRVNYRDGYYGLGAADFIMAQRIRSNLGFQVGGRISENDGYLRNSGLDGTQIRGDLYWRRENGWRFGLAFLNNRNKAEVTLRSGKRTLDRNDLFLTTVREDAGQDFEAVLHWYEAEELYQDYLDSKESGVDFRVLKGFNFLGFKAVPSLYLDYFNTELEGGSSEEVGRGIGSIAFEQALNERVSLRESVSLEVGRNIIPSAAVEGWYAFSEDNRAGFAAAHSGEPPAAIYRAKPYQASEMFLPGGAVWRLTPGAEILPNRELDPETVSSFRLFGYLKFFDLVSIKPSVLYKYVDNPIDIEPAGSDTYRWENVESQEFPALEGMISLGRRYGFNLEGAFTFQYPQEKRDFIPDTWGIWRLDYRNRIFGDELQYTIDLHCRYYGSREGMAGGNYNTLASDFTLGARVTFQVGNFMLFWGNENILSREYEIIPGYRMMHREEVWGVNWVFWN